MREPGALPIHSQVRIERYDRHRASSLTTVNNQRTSVDHADFAELADAARCASVSLYQRFIVSDTD
jgi:hypothetical protein